MQTQATTKVWTRGGVTIPARILEEIDAESIAGYGRGEEACGLLFGPLSAPLVIDEHVRLENRAAKLHALDPEMYPRTAREYFDIHPLAFARAVENGEKTGRPAKVLWHSHLDVGAYFSVMDAEAATAGGDAPTYDLAYLVISVRAAGVDDRRLFIFEGTSFIEAPFTTERP